MYFLLFENMHLLLYLILPGFVFLMVKTQTYFNKSMLISIFLVCFVHWSFASSNCVLLTSYANSGQLRSCFKAFVCVCVCVWS